ncbi:hypothetical protein NP493_603g02028 [Ridgeia piscesae]|uniref:TIL domain-containing protein n=1 Tax=Ridgeia piscesae TaxID=27915 RepID=A0AAD9KTT6_RIDPI|nr:hypothetical protein NP493_603g02028 [Ridgeia piscesae]
MQYCGALNNKRGPFSKCLRKKRTTGRNAYSSCMFDTCAHQRDLKIAKTLACQSVETFAKLCGNLAQGNTSCRVLCSVCTGELEWTTCGRRCTRTCSKPDVRCGFRCVKKCQCPRSAPYQQGTSCLTQAKCKRLHLWP